MAIKILSVDDEQDLEALLTQYFRRKIRKGEYEFSFAHNGLEALRMMLDHPDFDIILSDINMPEMDGLTLLTKINEMRNPALKCIIVSAYGDMENIRTAMNHIEIERDIVLEVRLRLPRYAGIAYIGEWFRPVHQPTGIKLGYHIRAYSPVILVHHLFQVLHVALPVRRRQRSRGGTALEQPASVRGEQRHVETGVRQLPLDLGVVAAMLLQGDILTLRHVRAELVLGLHHDDRAAFRHLQVADLLVKLIDIKLRAFQELRVIPADLHARYILQPPRITAELPLGAYVRAGTEDHHQSLLSRYPDILGQILVSLEIPFTRFRLVQVPEDIGSDRIQAHRSHHPKAMPPILVGDTRVMHLTREDRGYLPVYIKMTVLDLERTFLLGERADRYQHQKEQ